MTTDFLATDVAWAGLGELFSEAVMGRAREHEADTGVNGVVHTPRT